MAVVKTPFQQHSQYYKPEKTEQYPQQIVDVSDWSIGDLEIYEEGARDKAKVVAPAKPGYQFLIGGHPYLLKRTYSVKETGTILFEQFWNEIIAYQLGRVLQVKVPPAFLAYFAGDGQELYYGSLIEWFYAYGGKDEAKRGEDIIVNYIDDYDKKRGKQHNFQTVVQIFEDYQVENWLADLAEMLTFDAIIGNTDRHQNNWQIVDYTESGKRLLSPTFDNGTSLGYEIRSEHIAPYLAQGWEGKHDKRARKGYHHMRWEIDDAAQANHFDLLEKMADKFPDTRASITRILGEDIAPIFAKIDQLCEYELKDRRYELSRQRAEFIKRMICFRFNYARKRFEL